MELTIALNIVGVTFSVMIMYMGIRITQGIFQAGREEIKAIQAKHDDQRRNIMIHGRHR